MRPFFLLLLMSVLGSHAQTDTVITVNLENAAVQRYLSEVQYVNREDTSLVLDYNVAPPSRRDIPNAAVVPIPEVDADEVLLLCSDSADFASGRVQTFTVEKGATEQAIYNLVPQCIYYFIVLADGIAVSRGEIHTEGQVRMIYVPGSNNIRDMGGWPTADGKRIKYGKLFRGAELNGAHPADSAVIEGVREQLDIQAEIDMRAWYEEESGVSAFGFTSSYTGNIDEPPYYWTSDSGQLLEQMSQFVYQYRWRREFSFIVNNLKRDRNVFFHCVWGGDRTGYLALFMEGLLGVDYDGLIKDFELSSFYQGTRVKSKIDPVIDTIMTFEGNTLQEKFNSLFVRLIKSSQNEIDYFREVMLEDVKANGGDNPGGEGGPTTAIRSFEQEETGTKPVVYDLRGRKMGGLMRKGLVIEVGRDGRARKIAL